MIELREGSRVRASLERVFQNHPYADSGRIAKSKRSDSDAAAVWDRLRAIPLAQRDTAVRELRPHEVAVAIYGAPARITETECLDIAGRIIALRKPERAERLAFECLLLTDGNIDFRTLAAEYVRSSGAPQPWPSIVLAEKPIAAMLRLYEESRAQYERWSETSFLALDKMPEVERKLRRRLLRPEMMRVTLGREGIDTVFRWLNETLKTSELNAWYAEYLKYLTSKSSGDKWALDDPFLLRIADKFDVPSQGRGFWQPLGAKVIEAYELWLLNLQLTKSLGEGERVRFWRRFLPQMREARQSRDRQAVLICFDRWFAVQFVEMGRATYMLERRHLSRLARYSDYQLLHADVLRTARNVDGLETVGRYEHRGYSWEIGAEREVKRVMRILDS